MMACGDRGNGRAWAWPEEPQSESRAVPGRAPLKRRGVSDALKAEPLLGICWRPRQLTL